MSVFYVGQRVRIVKAVVSTFLIGTETFVLDPHAEGRGADGAPYRGVEVAAKNWCGNNLIARDGSLEPILPDDLESIEEINALYEPSPEVVKA